MELFGKILKDKKFWLIEIPILNALTQGKTQKDALNMAKDLIQEMAANNYPRGDLYSFILNLKLSLAETIRFFKRHFYIIA